MRERLEDATIVGCDRNGIIIGPEGGFDASEIEELMSVGAYPVSLGSNVLRAETAAVAAVSMISYHYMK